MNHSISRPLLSILRGALVAPILEGLYTDDMSEIERLMWDGKYQEVFNHPDLLTLCDIGHTYPHVSCLQHLARHPTTPLNVLKQVVQHPKAGEEIFGGPGTSALQFAATSKYPEIQKLVLQHPLSAIVRDEGGNTPLHAIAINTHFSQIKNLLRRHPMYREVRNNRGNTPEHELD